MAILNNLNLTITKRLLYYSLLAGLCVVVPYILTILLILITGDRYDGMTNAILPGLLSTQILFGLLFIKKSIARKIILSLILTLLIFGLVWLGMTMEITKTGFDSYGILGLNSYKFYRWIYYLGNILSG